jgi:D-alanyl-D-alanine carboxypeptidase
MRYIRCCGAYFPQVPNADEIKLNQMLNHTSGLKDYVSKSDSLHYWLKEPQTKKEIMNEIKSQGVAFEPGDSLSYSNSAYFLLARILENKYEKSFKLIIDEEIVQPLNLKNTFAIDEKSKPKNQAKSYKKENEDWVEIKEFYFPNASGTGDIFSTPFDMNTFLTALFNGKIIKEESLEMMLPESKVPFGKGLMQVPFYNHKGYGHGGDTFGSHSVAGYFPEDKLAITYIINGEQYSTNAFALDLLSIIYDRDYTLPVFGF